MLSLFKKSIIWGLRWLFFISLLLVTITIVFSVYLLVPVISDPSKNFIQRKGKIASVEENISKTADAIVSDVLIESSSGLKVRLKILRPVKTIERLPLIILLVGHRTGRNAVDLTNPLPGVVIAALSYPYYGSPKLKGLEVLFHLPQIQRGVLDTTPATLLAIEYLLQQPFVDNRRIELVGASLGAFFAAMPAAMDSRVGRVWLIHGAGQPQEVLKYRLKKYLRSDALREVTAKALGLIIGSRFLRPELWVQKIEDRPIIVVNARDDDSFPKTSVEVLHKALPENGEVVWMDGGHVGPHRQKVIDEIIALVTSRMRRNPNKKQRTK